MEQDQKKLIANPETVFREEFDDWALLFNPETGAVFGLNPVGAFIRKRLDGRHSMKEIISELQDNFDDVSPEVAREVNAYINELIEKGFAYYLKS